MSQLSNSRAAIRRCHRTLATVAVGIAAYGAALAAALPPAPAAPVHFLALTVASLPLPGPTAAALPVAELAVAIPNIVPLPKPASLLLAAISTPGLPIPVEELTCLAEAVYYEARGEPRDGQRAVAEVVARRTATRNFPKTICGVVYQDAGRRHGCQFSFACDGLNHGRRDPLAWKRAVAVAEYELAGPGQAESLTGGATYFHTLRVSPSWSRRFVRTVQIGNHVFYRQPGTLEANASS